MICETQLTFSQEQWDTFYLGNPPNLKHFLWSLFKDYNLDKNEPVFLYRHDLVSYGHIIFCRSILSPILERVPNGVDIKSKQIPEDKYEFFGFRSFKLRCKTERRICLNPYDPNISDPKVLEYKRGQLPQELIPQWLDKRFGDAAEVRDVIVNWTEPNIYFTNKNLKVFLSVSDVCGTINVVNGKLFKDLMINGVGGGRAWGLGLLISKPLVE